MEETKLAYPKIFFTAIGLAEKASVQGINLKILGGIGIRILCRSSYKDEFYRDVKDIDVAVQRNQLKKLVSFFELEGYKPRGLFNKLNIESRLIYYTREGQRIDVFVENFDMCHRIRLKDYFHEDGITLPPGILLLTKLQIRQMAEKDIKDVLLLLHDIEEETKKREFYRLAVLCSNDWGLFTTVMENIKLISSFSKEMPEVLGQKIRSRLQEIESIILGHRKTLRWKLRSFIGKKIKWYKEPDDVA